MNKQILYTTLLVLFLQPITLLCTDEAESQATFYTIPLINIPIAFEEKDEELTDDAILYIASQHALLVNLQKNDISMTLQKMIGQHALLWATKSIIGFLSTIGHELGHAIVWQQSGNCETTPRIVINYSPTALHTGIYSGITRATVNTKYKARKMILSHNREKTDTDNIIITNKEEYLEWANKAQKRCSQDIAVYLAGPTADILTAGVLIYALSHIPILWPNNIDSIDYAAILAINPIFATICDLFLSSNQSCDGLRAWKQCQQAQEIEELTEQIRALPDDSQITLYCFDE
jgi:hypothetical protein